MLHETPHETSHCCSFSRSGLLYKQKASGEHAELHGVLPPVCIVLALMSSLGARSRQKCSDGLVRPSDGGALGATSTSRKRAFANESPTSCLRTTQPSGQGAANASVAATDGKDGHGHPVSVSSRSLATPSGPPEGRADSGHVPSRVTFS